MQTTNRVAKIITPETRSRLSDYRDRNGLSNRTLGMELGYSSAAVSTYLNDDFKGDAEKFESAVENILRNEPIRKVVASETFETDVTSMIAGAIVTIMETNDFALIFGAAGIGKTVGAARFVAANPTSILVTLTQDCNNAHYIARELFAAVKSRAFFKSGLNRTEWIRSKFKGSNRLVLVDNAHRMTASARKWLFDFSDSTSCPVVLIGNPEVLDSIKLNDQQFSRIGLAPEVALDPEEIPSIVSRILIQMCPQHAEALQSYGVKVASQRGHLRALVKEVKLALNFISKGEKDAKAAFRAAHSQLVRNYDL